MHAWMERLLGLGIAVMIAADALVGVRLLLLARRTRRTPELAFALSFLLLGVVGYPLSIVARRAADPSALLAVALTAQDLACLCMYVATWRTFWPGSPWARALVQAAAGAFALSLLGDSLLAGRWSFHDGGAAYYLGFAARATAFVWAALEASRYHAMLRRRLALGLAEPVLVDRFRLWALAAASISLGFAVFLLGRLFTDNVADSPVVLAASSLVGISAGAAMLLAFAPPAAYLRRVAARAGAS